LGAVGKTTCRMALHIGGIRKCQIFSGVEYRSIYR